MSENNAPLSANASSSNQCAPAYQFNAAAHIALLRECINQKVWNIPHGQSNEVWNRVLSNFHIAIRKEKGHEQDETTAANLQKQYNKLLATFKKNQIESLRASGTDEQYTDRDELLQDIVDL
ncbi:hypothetical protein HK098_007942, partial [Nowakowskiella sp. JEL0407]